jgi:hypothetical protein
MLFGKGTSDWIVVKNDLDIPTFRYSEIVGFIYKGNDGKCYYDMCAFGQQYEGGGIYGQIQLNYYNFERLKGLANCNAIK